MNDLSVDLDALTSFSGTVRAVGDAVSSALAPGATDLTDLAVTLGIVAAEFVVGVGEAILDHRRSLAAAANSMASVADSASATRVAYDRQDRATATSLGRTGTVA